jgi:hypothetical protein
VLQRKLLPKWDGPYEVVRFYDNGTIKLRKGAYCRPTYQHTSSPTLSLALILHCESKCHASPWILAWLRRSDDSIVKSVVSKLGFPTMYKEDLWHQRNRNDIQRTRMKHLPRKEGQNSALCRN